MPALISGGRKKQGGTGAKRIVPVIHLGTRRFTERGGVNNPPPNISPRGEESVAPRRPYAGRGGTSERQGAKGGRALAHAGKQGFPPSRCQSSKRVSATSWGNALSPENGASRMARADIGRHLRRRRGRSRGGAGDDRHPHRGCRQHSALPPSFTTGRGQDLRMRGLQGSHARALVPRGRLGDGGSVWYIMCVRDFFF